MNKADCPDDLAAALDAWRPLIDALSDLVSIVDEDARLRLANRRLAEALSRPAAELEGRPLGELGLPDDLAERWTQVIAQVFADGQARLVEHDAGEHGAQVSTRLQPLNLPGGRTGLLCTTRGARGDDTPREQLAREALLDPLTGLVNRRGFEQALERLLQNARETGVSHALCYLDLDRFKEVNDSCGHSAGDGLLRQLPSVLRPLIREEDTLARLGGDEFGILLHRCSLDDAQRIAQKLRDAVQRFRFVWQARTFSLGVSIGIVGLRPDTESESAVLSEADAACYSAKEQGRNSVHVSYPHDLTVIRQRGEQRWAQRLRRALAEPQGFDLHYQSIVSLGDEAAVPTRHELLLRLPDARGRPILPGAFLPAAERHGLISQVDIWVIRRGLALIGEELRGRLHGHCFGINLSPVSLADPALLEAIRQGLREYELPPETLYFELRETAFNLNLGAALEFMRALNELGCGLALDAFGSGVSSFSYLKSLPVDMIKIDRGLISEMLGSPADEAIVRAINDIAHKLSIATVAEAIESESVLAVLRDIGIDYAQGFVFGRPRPLAEFAQSAVPAA